MRVRDARALARRRERERTGLFFVEGVRAVALALELGWSVEAVLHAPAALDSDLGRRTLAAARAGGVAAVAVGAAALTGLTGDGRDSTAAVVRQRWLSLDDLDPAAGLCLVALDAVQYPGNLGTVLRTAEAVGAAGVLLLDRGADPYDPLALRASLGAIFTVRLARATFEQLRAWARDRGTRIVGTSPAAALDYRGASYAGPLVLLFGSERRGLSPPQLAACDAVVRIPMAGRGDSLNLAVAAALLLYEADRERRGRSEQGR